VSESLAVFYQIRQPQKYGIASLNRRLNTHEQKGRLGEISRSRLVFSNRREPMIIADDQAYFACRLEAELNMAGTAKEMEAKLIHLALAAAYRKNIAQIKARRVNAEESTTRLARPQAA
jgi:hypothetical protein